MNGSNSAKRRGGRQITTGVGADAVKEIDRARGDQAAVVEREKARVGRLAFRVS
jgi:hypothetical protein